MFPGLFSPNLSFFVPTGGDPNYVIFWNFRSDVDNVTVVKGSDKMTMTLAEARFKALKDHSIPDLGIQGHVVEPLKIEKDWVETFIFKPRKNLLITSKKFGKSKKLLG